MKSVLYFHGFASSPGSAKITALRPLLAARGIELNTPDLNVPSFERLDWDALVEHAAAVGSATPPRAIAGSSMGALVALAVAARWGTGNPAWWGTGNPACPPLVLTAPALGVAERWREKTPPGDPIVVFNHARGGDAPIHRRFFEQMMEVRIDEQPPAARVTVIMGRLAETVPFDMVEARWKEWERSGRLAPGSKFIELPEGDHGLVADTGLIADAIVEAAS